ncbi:alpha-L-fucosidase [Niabella hirudinis]|uniref:alpha-L-fucosidase n=1 Tax=Niabella hirudinis TaxID=1285929 RepID=UPI003EB97453
MKKWIDPVVPVLIISILAIGCSPKVMPPAPYGALPGKRQLEWHKMETYAFLHFTVNTFTGKEWGYGDEKEDVFNPTDFDADQIIGTLAKAGFKGAIITAKHHDGFCLWPSAYTNHSVKNSSWKNGKGDVVRELSRACKKYGIKFGVYLSPWDRNHADYGTTQYITYYRNQLKELLTQYGAIFEVWLDGANGGDGYYGGAKEKRFIDRSHYYDWEETFKLVRRLQPNAIMFSDAGPDIRWVGNEHGHAKDSCWATYTPLPAKGFTKAYAGTCQYWLGETGTRNGQYWMPAETDVSIRPGWFFHPAEDSKVKSLSQLMDIYFHSVGNGTSLNLNIPPDRTGKIHTTDSLRLMEFRNYLDRAFSKNLLRGCKAWASDTRGRAYKPGRLTDNNPETYWAAKDGTQGAIVEFELNGTKTINCLVLQEYIALGQRISGFTVEYLADGQWKQAARGSTIGYKKIVRFAPCSTGKIRLRLEAMASPLLSEAAAYEIPEI